MYLFCTHSYLFLSQSGNDPSLLPSLKSIAQEATNRAGLCSPSDHPLLSLTSSQATPQQVVPSGNNGLVQQQPTNSSNLSPAQPPVVPGNNPNISQTSKKYGVRLNYVQMLLSDLL